MPMSNELREMEKGYRLRNSNHEISHLLYMDDIKLFSRSEDGLKLMVDTVGSMAEDIGMSFGYEKCAQININRGNIINCQNRRASEQEHIMKELDTESHYKYLGIFENSRIKQSQMKEKIKVEYFRRLRLVLKTSLNGRNKIEAINSIPVPILEYSFGIIDWTKAELRKFDTQTRKLMTCHHMLHPRSSVNRIYLPRVDGGRGLRNVENTYNIAILRFAKYVNKKCQSDDLIRITHEYMSNSTHKNLLKQASKLEHDLQLDIDESMFVTPYNYLNKYKNQVKKSIVQNNIRDWKDKPLHGQFLRQIDSTNMIDKNRTFDWLKMGKLKCETEAYILSAQDQSLRTKYYDKHILKLNTDDKCRLCKTQPEHINHIVSGCEILAKHEYLLRHNKVCTYLHYNVCQHYKFPNIPDKWYKHQPEPVVQHEDITILYDQQIRTDRTIKANKPDLVIKNIKEKKCHLIDVSVPADSNVDKKEAEKRLKYKDLAIEVERMWGMRCHIIPVIIGALGCVPVSLDANLKLIPGIYNVAEVQSCAILGTAHILRKFGV